MHEESLAFIEHLLARTHAAFPQAYLTLSAIHPERKHAVPSRHIPLHDNSSLKVALNKLLQSNELGYGAFVAIGLRKQNLGRWRRGGQADVLALPALFVDIDAAPDEALRHLVQHDPPPSCIVKSGGGLHAYWWLEKATIDLVTATRALTSLRQQFASDSLSISQSMRLVGSRNTKSNRNNALCTLHSLSNMSYPLDAFAIESSQKTDQTGQTHQTDHFSSLKRPSYSKTRRELNPRLIHAVCAILEAHYGGFWRRSAWLAARCPYPHQHDTPGAHFSFNPRIGLGVCLGKHGRMLLKDLCAVLRVRSNDYGGMFR
jgi:hypothetical protein